MLKFFLLSRERDNSSYGMTGQAICCALLRAQPGHARTSDIEPRSKTLLPRRRVFPHVWNSLLLSHGIV